MAMANNQCIVLTEANLNKMNVSKRRPLHPENDKRCVAKRRKDAGEPYIGKNGVQRPAILPPTAVS